MSTKILQAINNKKVKIAICLSLLAIISIVSVLSMQVPPQPETEQLSGGSWIMPVPADQGTGKVIQQEIAHGVSGTIPSDVWGAYPSISKSTGFDLTSTPILSVDVYADKCFELYIIAIDQTDGAWNPAAFDVTSQYGKAGQSNDGSPIRIANSTSPQHFEIDLRTAGIPLNHIGTVAVNIVTGYKGFEVHYEVTNLSVTAGGNGGSI